MIQITRSLARHVRAVFRHLARKSPGASEPAVSFETGPDGLHVRLHNTEVTAEFHESGALARDSVVIPLDALAQFEGRQKDAVTLEGTGDGVQARWQDGVVPQVREYPAPKQNKLSPVLDRPLGTMSNEPGFFQALADAVKAASHESVRYALDRVQLRGKTGEIVATDAHQLLVQSGFHFGWDDDLLIPASAVFSGKVLPRQEPVAIGKTATHVTMTAGPWTLHFPIDTQGQFPQTDQIIPSLTKVVSRAHIDATDSEFLLQALPRLVGKADDDATVTLDLNGRTVVRARASDDGRATELDLVRSATTGTAVRISMNRQHLARALGMGLSEVCVVSADKPFVFRDQWRKFLVMPLGKDAIVGPGDNTIRISSANSESEQLPKASKQEPVVSETQTVPIASGKPSVNGTKKATRTVTKITPRKATVGTLAALVTEAESLKNDLRQAYTRAHLLLSAIKKHRRQTKLVQSTLATLQQIKNVAA